MAGQLKPLTLRFQAEDLLAASIFMALAPQGLTRMMDVEIP
jgi:hypothetical protein